MKVKHTFQEARRITRKHGFYTKTEFFEYDCPGAYGVPKNVEELYRNEGWKGWDDFLGVPLSFMEGKICIASKNNCAGENKHCKQIKTKEEYFQFVRERQQKGNEDDPSSRLPMRPDIYYKEEWISWEDWLGLATSHT